MSNANPQNANSNQQQGPGQHPQGPAEVAPAQAAASGQQATEAGVGAEAGPHDAARGMQHHDDVIAALRRELSDQRERTLRAHADVENIRKRAEREKEETAKYAVTKFARDMLAISDNLQRAVGSVPAGAIDTAPALKSLFDGVTLTDRELLNVLERHGVKRIEAQDALFNPHFHQAVMQMDNPAVPAGTITKVFQSGYTIEDRVLRPAMVVVAQGGPNPGETPTSTAAPAAPHSEPPAG